MIVVLSPHLDDAVLSCGGLLADAARRGERALVVTVFTEGAGSARRCAEDAAALGDLGAEPLHLGLADAPERLGLARSYEALVERARLEPTDVHATRVAIERCLGALPRAEVYAPLGVGGHVDHLTVHAAVRPWTDVAYYEDRPYAFVPGALRARLAEAAITLEAPEPDLASAPEPGASRRAYAELPHLRAFLSEEPAARERSLRLLDERHQRPRVDVSLPPRTVRARRRAVDEATSVLVAQAASAYASQGVLLPAELPRFERTYHPLAPRNDGARATSPHDLGENDSRPENRPSSSRL